MTEPKLYGVAISRLHRPATTWEDACPRSFGARGSACTCDGDALEAALEEAQRVKWRAQFEDMGYEDCETCRRARLRDSFVGDGA